MVTMHSNAEAFTHMQNRIAPLMKRLEDFITSADKSISNETFSSMRKELSDAKEALATLVHNGYNVGESWGISYKSFIDAAQALLEQVEKCMVSARQRLAQVAYESYINSIFAPPLDVKLLAAKFRPLLKLIAPLAVRLAFEKDALHMVALEFAKDPSPQTRNDLQTAIEAYNNNSQATEAVNIATRLVQTAIELLSDNAALLKGLVARTKPKLPQNVRDTITLELVAEFEVALNEFARAGLEGPQPKAFVAFYRNGNSYKTQLAHFDDMLKTVARMGDQEFLTSKTFLSMFNGAPVPSTLVEARMHGMCDEDVDSATDQSNVLGTQVLGCGTVNTVTAVTFKNGEIRVFKAEAPGRACMESDPYVFEGYEKGQQMSQLNMATQKTAEVLGLGDVMVKTSVGKFNGQFGIFMENAPGTQISYFIKNQKIASGSLNRSQVQMLPDEEHAKVQGNMMRKCNRLDWLDVITGQGDRHNGNILLNVTTDGKVDIKGIDNDICYPAFRIGMQVYIIAGRHLELFKERLDVVSYLYGADNKAVQMQRLLSDKGVTKNADGTYVLNASKFEAPELNYCLMYTFALHSTYVPNVIDQDLYDHLQTLKIGSPQRDHYFASLANRISPAALAAAVKRLDEVLRHANELETEGMVYSETDWNDRENQKSVYNDPNDQMPILDKQFGTIPHKNLNCYARIEEGIRCLTQGNYKRNLFNMSAKVDWFC